MLEVPPSGVLQRKPHAGLPGWRRRSWATQPCCACHAGGRLAGPHGPDARSVGAWARAQQHRAIWGGLPGGESVCGTYDPHPAHACRDSRIDRHRTESCCYCGPILILTRVAAAKGEGAVSYHFPPGLASQGPPNQLACLKGPGGPRPMHLPQGIAGCLLPGRPGGTAGRQCRGLLQL
jgi:hypothetical protein